MHLISRPDGYTTHQTVYINPVPFIPPSKTLHDKKDTTLLEMAMKAFLKQRLYGGLHNFNMNNVHKKDNFSIAKGPETQRTKFSASLTNMKQEKHQINRKNRNKNYSALDQASFTYLDKQSKQVQYQNGSIKQMTLLNKVKEGRYSSNRSSLDFKNPSKSNPLHQTTSGRSCSQNFSQNANLNSRKLTAQDKYDDFIGNSFISAIEYQQQYNPLSNRQKVLNILKLPEITAKRQKSHKNLSNRDVQKKYKLIQKKQSEISCKISDQFWCLISKAKFSKPNKEKQTNLQNSSLVYNQSNLGVKTNVRIFQPNFGNKSQNECLSGQGKFASIPKNNDNIFLNKEVFQEIMTRSKLSISLFTSVILNFFEIPAKIHEKMKKQDLQALLSQAFSMHDRGWGVAIFRFLDINHDGQIDSSDLFKIYNYLDEMKVKLEQIQKQQTILDTNSYSSKRDVSNVKKREITQNQSRQKTQNSQYTVHLKLQKDLITRNNKKSSSIKKKTVQNQLPQEVYHFSKTITSNNLKNLDKLQNQIRKFNKFVVQKHNQQKKISENANPEVQTAKDEGIDTKIDVQTVYLEEALLKNQGLKYTDLNLILSHISNDNKAIKKKVIEIDHKKLNIKLSSTYVQTFGATDHNEGTRVNREYIQTLKEYLKKENQQTKTSSNRGEKKTLPSLKYAEFYEEKMHIPLKTLLFSLMHAEIAYLN